MDILKTVLTIIFVIDCIALACIILLQEGKSAVITLVIRLHTSA